MQMPDKLTLTYDDTGRICTVLHAPDGSQKLMQYRSTNILPSTSIQPVQQVCPFCNAPLFIGSQETYCVNIHCTPRRQRILSRQLDHLHLTVEAESDIMGAFRALNEPSTLFQLIPYLKGTSKDLICQNLRSLSFVDYLRLIQVPEISVRALEPIVTNYRTRRDLHYSIVLGHLFDVAYAEHLALTRLAAGVVNHGFAEGLACYQ